MSAPLSNHIPGVAGATESITASLVVNTGLQRLQSFVPSIQASAMSANEEATVSWEEQARVAGEPVKVKIFVWKGGTASGSAGDSAVNVSWIAIGE